VVSGQWSVADEEEAMEMTKVSCNGCGAALQVPEGARFVTCRYCNASLEIKRTESAVYTETLERIDQRTAAMAEDLDAIRQGQEMERLDREWALRRAGFMRLSKDGTEREPSVAAGVLSIVIGGGFGLFWTVMAFGITSRGMGMGAPGPVMIFPLFGVLFIAGAVVMGLMTISRALRLQQAQREYERRRGEMAARGEEGKG
jgi:LSD1 subclass zinc finger protein